jgi:antitoxin HigA-1
MTLKLQIITEVKVMKTPSPRPIHPGEILREDFLPEYELSAGSLARAIGVPRDRLEKIIRESRAVTADTAARLGRYFGTTPQFWLNLQANFDLAQVNQISLAGIIPTQSSASHALGFQEDKTEFNLN